MSTYLLLCICLLSTGSSASSSSASSSSASSSSASSSSVNWSSASSSSASAGSASSSSAGGEAVPFDDTNSDEWELEDPEIFPPDIADPLFPPCCGREVPACNPADRFRRHDGSCNNFEHPEWGVPNSIYPRLMPPQYADGLMTPRRTVGNGPLPSSRRIRTHLFPTGKIENKLWTVNIMQWGQFLAHDMSMMKEHDKPVSCCTWNGKVQKGTGRFCYPIKIPLDDPTMGKAGIRCMKFVRTVTDKDLGCSVDDAPAQQINAVTSFVDLSNVYGNSDAVNRALRTLRNGELKTEIRKNKSFPPNEPNKKSNCPCNALNENVCYKTGDPRSNATPQLAILQIMFLREHNRLARGLKAINPKWDDERLYQEARRINIAAYQHVTYNEWLPILLGDMNLSGNKIIFPNAPGFVNDYNSTANPGVINEHANAAYRQFHTQIVGMLKLMDSKQQILSTVSLSNWFNRPQILETGTNMEQLTVGLVTQNVEESDQTFVEQISDKLFVCRGFGFGKDMKAVDIQRDRDHALGYYNDYRKYCGLKIAQSFDDYGDLISAENIAVLKDLYSDYRDVDVSVGGGLENLAPGAQVGPTFLCILNEQFRRTRQADRFWFENAASGLTIDQLKEIKKSTASRLFCDNGDGIREMQPRAFVLRSLNAPLSCKLIPGMDLNKWKDASC